jgi:hypothetical protein
LKKDSNTLVSFKIHLFIIKNTLLCFNIHTCTFQIHNRTFQKPYILLTYITIYYYTPISFHLHPYTLRLSWDLYISHPFVLSLTLFFKTVMVPHYFTKTSMACHDIFVGIQKSNIFHKFPTSYWLIKYLNPKLISRDSINTCWTYSQWQNHLPLKGRHWN